MTTTSHSGTYKKRELTNVPTELIHGQSKKNEQLRPFLIRGRELSNAGPNYIPYFFMLTEEARDNLLKKIKTVRYFDQGMFEKESAKPNKLHIIFSGEVHLTTDNTRRTYRIRETFPNHTEFALLTEELLAESVVDFNKTVFSVINKSDFINWLLYCPDVSFGLLDVLSESK